MVPSQLGQVLNAGVWGSPIAHSLSPALHRSAYAALGLTQWTYAAREVTEAEFIEAVGGLDQQWRGLSLTMPLKHVAAQVATQVSDVAREAGAINTLVRRDDGGWDADNTDVAGLVRALSGVDHGGGATILGSGATARSAALALAECGVCDVVVAARNRAAAAEVVQVLRRRGVGARDLALSEWAREQHGLVVSTLAPAASEAVASRLQDSLLAQGNWALLDVVYADWPTPLARASQAVGAEVISGLDMLVYQAAEQVFLMTGHRAPVEVMFAAGRAALGATTT